MPETPLVVDIDGDGIEFIALADSTVRFDVNVDGFAERTGWVAADDAFLAFDRNGDGLIDDSTALFGADDGHSDGFSRLADLDMNGDGVIDRLDADVASLQLWQRANADGGAQMMRASAFLAPGFGFCP